MRLRLIFLDKKLSSQNRNRKIVLIIPHKIWKEVETVVQDPITQVSPERKQVDDKLVTSHGNSNPSPPATPTTPTPFSQPIDLDLSTSTASTSEIDPALTINNGK